MPENKEQRHEMAWNEPGGDDKKDPWGNQNNDGPPDLDEVIRNMQKKLGGLFGKKGGGGAGGSGSGDGSFGLIAMIVTFLFLAYIALQSPYRVEEAQRGVVLRFGEFQSIAMPGLNFKIPFVDEVYKIDVNRVETIPHKAQMLTQDENIVEVELAVQFHVGDPKEYLFNVRSPETTLRHAIESAVREVVGKSKMDYVITDGRDAIAQNTKLIIQEILDRYQAGLVIQQATLQDAKPPDQVKEAFYDAIRAREDEVRYRNKAEAYAKGVLPDARGRAARLIEDAKAYKEQVIAQADGETQRFINLLIEYGKSPKVTRDRMYLEAMEEVYSKTNKVMIDIQDGNNIMYLPLDQILSQTRYMQQSEQSRYNNGQSLSSESSQSSSSQDRVTNRTREVR